MVFGSKGTGKTSLVESTRLRIRPIRSTTQTIVTATPTQQPHTNKQEPFRAIFGALQSDDHDLDYIRNEMKKDGEKKQTSSCDSLEAAPLHSFLTMPKTMKVWHLQQQQNDANNNEARYAIEQGVADVENTGPTFCMRTHAQSNPQQ